VKLSADGVPFLLHDDTLDRTTPEVGLASARPWSELAQIDAGRWQGPQWIGERLASLEKVAQFLLAQECVLNLEIKPTPGDEEGTGRIVGEAAQRLWTGCVVPPLLSSFQTEALRGAMKAAPALPRALLLSERWSGWQSAARALGVVAVVSHWRLMSAELLARLHGEGWRALVYTVNDPVEAERLLSLPGGGVDGIITDEVERWPALRALHRPGLTSPGAPPSNPA
jgi:glycerophosphoryl diester phosphodiesterase